MMNNKIEEIVKAYRDYKSSPFSDEYTRVALENKYFLNIDEIKKIYEENKPIRKRNNKSVALDDIKTAIDEMPYENMINEKKAFEKIKEIIKQVYGD